MKITRKQLRQIIKEELGRLEESDTDDSSNWAVDILTAIGQNATVPPRQVIPIDDPDHEVFEYLADVSSGCNDLSDLLAGTYGGYDGLHKEVILEHGEKIFKDIESTVDILHNLLEGWGFVF